MAALLLAICLSLPTSSPGTLTGGAGGGGVWTIENGQLVEVEGLSAPASAAVVG